MKLDTKKLAIIKANHTQHYATLMLTQKEPIKNYELTKLVYFLKSRCEYLQLDYPKSEAFIEIAKYVQNSWGDFTIEECNASIDHAIKKNEIDPRYIKKISPQLLNRIFSNYKLNIRNKSKIFYDNLNYSN